MILSNFYQVVDNPIDILKIQQKLKTDEYTDMEELRCQILFFSVNKFSNIVAAAGPTSP